MMHIIICGAGQVGSHAAKVLATLHHEVTLIDHHAEKLDTIDQAIDIRTLFGNAAHADILCEAGAVDADMLIAATRNDETNLLVAAIAKGIGTKTVMARVHHSAYFDQRGMDYKKLLRIDRLMCPDYSTAHAIAAMLRSPGALAIESFGSGNIAMQEIHVPKGAHIIGRKLMDLKLPAGVRFIAVQRYETNEVFIPNATTELDYGDVVSVVGNEELFSRISDMFGKSEKYRQRVVIMGGAAMAVWLCRALKERRFSIRLFETNRKRAEELASKLEWVTVIHDDPTNQLIVEEERLNEADVFVSLCQDDDERNIISCAVMKNLGVKQTIAVVQRPELSHLLQPIGVDAALTPRTLAAGEIIAALDEYKLLNIAGIAGGIINVYRAKIGADSTIAGKSLREVKITSDWMIAAVQHDDDVHVPRADDQIHPDDTVLVIGKQGMEKQLKEILGCQ